MLQFYYYYARTFQSNLATPMHAAQNLDGSFTVTDWLFKTCLGKVLKTHTDTWQLNTRPASTFCTTLTTRFGFFSSVSVHTHTQSHTPPVHTDAVEHSFSSKHVTFAEPDFQSRRCNTRLRNVLKEKQSTSSLKITRINHHPLDIYINSTVTSHVLVAFFTLPMHEHQEQHFSAW